MGKGDQSKGNKMATRDVEGRAASKVYRLARGFGDDGETVVGYIAFLRDNRVGVGVILPLAGLIESTFVGNKPSAGSQSVRLGCLWHSKERRVRQMGQKGQRRCAPIYKDGNRHPNAHWRASCRRPKGAGKSGVRHIMLYRESFPLSWHKSDRPAGHTRIDHRFARDVLRAREGKGRSTDCGKPAARLHRCKPCGKGEVNRPGRAREDACATPKADAKHLITNLIAPCRNVYIFRPIE